MGGGEAVSDPPYWNTKVPVSRSMVSIQKLVEKFGAQEYGFRTTLKGDNPTIDVGFVYKDKPVRLTVKVRQVAEVYLDLHPNANHGTVYDKAPRVAMRILHDQIKAILIAVDCGLVDFETAFMPHFITRTGRTLAEETIPRFDRVLSQPSLLLGSGKEGP